MLLCVTRMVVACGILSSRGRQITVYSPQRGNTQDRTDHSKGMRAAVDRRYGVIKPPSRRSAGLHRSGRAWEHMTTREAWPQAQAQMSESGGGGRHAEQATHAIRHSNQSTLQTSARGRQGEEEGGGGTRVTKRRAFLRRTCQSRGAQVVGGGWTNRAGWHRPTSGRLAT